MINAVNRGLVPNEIRVACKGWLVGAYIARRRLLLCSRDRIVVIDRRKGRYKVPARSADRCNRKELRLKPVSSALVDVVKSIVAVCNRIQKTVYHKWITRNGNKLGVLDGNS